MLSTAPTSRARVDSSCTAPLDTLSCTRALPPCSMGSCGSGSSTGRPVSGGTSACAATMVDSLRIEAAENGLPPK